MRDEAVVEHRADTEQEPPGIIQRPPAGPEPAGKRFAQLPDFLYQQPVPTPTPVPEPAPYPGKRYATMPDFLYQQPVPTPTPQPTPGGGSPGGGGEEPASTGVPESGTTTPPEGAAGPGEGAKEIPPGGGVIESVIGIAIFVGISIAQHRLPTAADVAGAVYPPAAIAQASNHGQTAFPIIVWALLQAGVSLSTLAAIAAPIAGSMYLGYGAAQGTTHAMIIHATGAKPVRWSYHFYAGLPAGPIGP